MHGYIVHGQKVNKCGYPKKEKKKKKAETRRKQNVDAISWIQTLP